MNLNCKIALVTGASSGAATAMKLAENGVKVGLAARRMDRLASIQQQIRAAGGDAIAIAMDVADVGSVKAGTEKLVAAYGTIDIAFNNAGLMPASDIETLKVSEWQRMVDVNVKGVLNTTASVLPYMIKQRAGHIINTSSIAGRKVFAGLAVYCATKHAITALSEGLRLELSRKHNIRVTCIQPGAADRGAHRRARRHPSSRHERRRKSTSPRSPSTRDHEKQIRAFTKSALRAKSRPSRASLFA